MTSILNSLTPEPPNAVLGLAQECNADIFPDKINLTIGAYRGEDGKPYVLPCVREAEKAIFETKFNHEYLLQDGLTEFNLATQKLLLGSDSQLISSGRIYTIQSVAGTGALRLGTEFIKRVRPDVVIAIPNYTWQNHPTIVNAAGITLATYTYLDATATSFDYEGMLASLEQLPENAIILLHSCAHNPSGSDPTDEQWKGILSVMKRRNLFPFFDNAYQGFVSGDPDVDAFSVRLFAADPDMEMIIACSFSKNFGLYGERVGALHIITRTTDQAETVATILRAVARCLYSTCPSYGSRIVSYILSDEERKNAWKRECAAMAHRLNDIRANLHAELVQHNVKGKWEHVRTQRGMFSFSGISRDAVLRLKHEYHVYLLEDGRVSLAGLNSSNLQKFVKALVDVLGTN